MEVVRVKVGDDPRAHRLEGVSVLGPPHRSISSLPGALTDIVSDGVAKHVIQRLFLSDIAAGLANDHHQLALILEHLSGVFGHDYVVAVFNQGVDGPVANIGLFRQNWFFTAHLGGPGHMLRVVDTSGIKGRRDDRNL